jgi:pilus assembly protein CpaE
LLRSIIICPDREMALRLESALATISEISAGHTMRSYPSAVDLVRALRADAPDVLFLSFESVEMAKLIIGCLEAEGDALQVIAIHRNSDPSVLREAMRAGVRDFVADPFDRRALLEAIARVKGQLEHHPSSSEFTGQIFSFLPSKAGVGASTLALNLSAALARRPETHVLLTDFDLSAGMMRFMLKLQNEYSVIDAIEHSHELDERLWTPLVTPLDALDVLHAGRINPNIRIETPQVRSLIEFMRRHYQVLCFDLSANLESYALEIMRESKRVLTVCTPEIASLQQAGEKLHFLRTLDLESRVSIILNRCHKKALFTKEQVEEFLGMPVLTTFPNDYAVANRAMMAGTLIEQKSGLGKSMELFAKELIERRPVPLAQAPEVLGRFAYNPRKLFG